MEIEIDKVHYVDKHTDKIRVPNGWLYRTICGKNNSRPNVHTVFVSDVPIIPRIGVWNGKTYENN